MENITIIKKDNVFHITLNFLGGLQTFANSEDDIDVAVNEAIECFVYAAENFGDGLIEELSKF